jgi:hypothetical protein
MLGYELVVSHVLGKKIVVAFLLKFRSFVPWRRIVGLNVGWFLIGWGFDRRIFGGEEDLVVNGR